MENSNFAETLKVTWEALIASLRTSESSLFSLEGICLIGFGLLCIFVTRRYLRSLAAARTLQPAAAKELQQSLQYDVKASTPPLSAPLHNVTSVPEVITGTSSATSHAA